MLPIRFFVLKPLLHCWKRLRKRFTAWRRKHSTKVRPNEPETGVTFGGFIPKPQDATEHVEREIYVPDSHGGMASANKNANSVLNGDGSGLAWFLAAIHAPFVVKRKRWVTVAFFVLVLLCFWQATKVEPASEPPNIVRPV